MAYAKGARTFERHIDIDDDGIPVSPYCSLPEQCDEWFKAFHKAREMCGSSRDERRYAARARRSATSTRWSAASTRASLPRGRGAQATTTSTWRSRSRRARSRPREFMRGEVLLHDVQPDAPIMIDAVDSPYAENEGLKGLIYDRGIEPLPPVSPPAPPKESEAVPNGRVGDLERIPPDL